MPRYVLFARVLVGLAFTVFGANHLVEILPEPDGTAEGRAFSEALADTGYMWELVKGTELVGGLLVLSGIWVPLGLLLLAPVVVNILAFNLALDPEGLPIGGALAALVLLLAWGYRESFRPLFRVG